LSETAEARSAFEAYRTALLRLELTHAWRGHGSALMLEFGTLTPRARRDGTPGNATGEYSAMLEWSWRIESDNSILCGAWSDEDLWDAAIADLKGRKVTSLELFGRLPELAIGLSGGRYVSSFMIAAGQPAWTLLHEAAPEGSGALAVDSGHLTLTA
jgi:hypothetical protein